MLDLERIIALFALLGEIDESELESCRVLCEGAAAKVERRIRPEPDREKLDRVDMERLCAAAAALAYCDYTKLHRKNTFAGEEIRVGDISLKQSVGVTTADARDTLDYFMEQAADLLLPPTQVLRQVEL